ERGGATGEGAELPGLSVLRARRLRRILAPARLAGGLRDLSPRAAGPRTGRAADPRLAGGAGGARRPRTLGDPDPTRPRPPAGMAGRLASARSQPPGARPPVDGAGSLPVLAVARTAVGARLRAAAASGDRGALDPDDRLRRPHGAVRRHLPRRAPLHRRDGAGRADEPTRLCREGPAPRSGRRP